MAKAAMKIRPLGDRILVKRVEAEEKTKGGIVLPDTAKEKPKEGIVKALGQGKLLESGERAQPQVKVNDRVIFTSYAGTEVKVEGEEYLLMGEDDILAVIES
jgi:chaperonin GroES